MGKIEFKTSKSEKKEFSIKIKKDRINYVNSCEASEVTFRRNVDSFLKKSLLRNNQNIDSPRSIERAKNSSAFDLLTHIDQQKTTFINSCEISSKIIRSQSQREIEPKYKINVLPFEDKIISI